MKIAAGIAAGLLLWLVTQTFALGLAGGGDGWDAPAVLSLALLPLSPLVFARMFQQRLSWKIDGATVLVAAALDGFLLYNTRIQEPGYFAKACDIVPSAVSGWFALWAGWQLVALMVFVRAWLTRNEAQTVR